MPKVGAVLDREWHAAVGREGLAPSPVAASASSDDDELPCPACGTAAPLIAGACSDCGLQLDDAPASCSKPGCGTSGGCR